jgi:beta-glucanase (GH16 family)
MMMEKKREFRKWRLHALGVITLVTFSTVIFAQEWTRVWGDEFDGNELDPGKWSCQTGTGVEYGIPDWGNAELQYYKEENAVVSDGVLTITAKKDFTEGKSYTSARIRTYQKMDWLYGRFEFRAKMPIGKGLWAAIWMLPSYDEYGGWAASGEIDIMEYLGDSPNTVHGTLHFGDEWPNNKLKGTDFVLDSGDFHSEFHEFSLEWEEGEMRWYVDGELYQTLGQGDWYTQGNSFPAPFNKRFHLLINLAVGGNWPGAPDYTTEFPQDLIIDYVRVFQKFGVGIEPDNPGELLLSRLDQNHPNPFRSVTTLPFSLEEETHISLDLFDTMGRKVLTLVNEKKAPGTYSVDLDGSMLPPGIYSSILKAGDLTEVKKLMRL